MKLLSSIAEPLIVKVTLSLGLRLSLQGQRFEAYRAFYKKCKQLGKTIYKC